MRDESPTTEPVALEAAPRNARNAKRKAIAPLAVEVDTSETPLRAKRDGCGCPPWTISCAHFGESRMVLTDLFDVAARHTCRRQSWAGEQFSVGECWGEHWRCSGCGLDGLATGNALADFPDLPSAQAEFDVRAEELRAG